MFPYDLVKVFVITILDPLEAVENGPCLATQDDSEDDSENDDPFDETHGNGTKRPSPPSGEALSPELGDDGHDEAVPCTTSWHVEINGPGRLTTAPKVLTAKAPEKLSDSNNREGCSLPTTIFFRGYV